MRIALFTMTLALFSCVTPAHAQSAPVPAQLSTARTAFIGNGGAPAGGPKQNLVSGIVYASVYAALTKSQYQLVSAPSDAELSLVISTDEQVSDATHGNSVAISYLQLEIYDTKTHTLLWTVQEPIQGAFREKTFRKNVDQSAAAILSDVNLLAAGKIPGETDADQQPTTQSTPTKTRFSDEGKK